MRESRGREGGGGGPIYVEPDVVEQTRRPRRPERPVNCSQVSHPERGSDEAAALIEVERLLTILEPPVRVISTSLDQDSTRQPVAPPPRFRREHSSDIHSARNPRRDNGSAVIPEADRALTSCLCAAWRLPRCEGPSSTAEPRGSITKTTQSGNLDEAELP